MSFQENVKNGFFNFEKKRKIRVGLSGCHLRVWSAWHLPVWPGGGIEMCNYCHKTHTCDLTDILANNRNNCESVEVM